MAGLLFGHQTVAFKVPDHEKLSPLFSTGWDPEELQSFHSSPDPTSCWFRMQSCLMDILGLEIVASLTMDSVI